MSSAFINGVREGLPEAQITFDKFHIMKIINEAVDNEWREEVKTNPLLRGTRYVFLKNENNLTVKQKLESVSFKSEIHASFANKGHLRENIRANQQRRH